MLIKSGSTSVSIDVQVVDDSGLPVTGKNAAQLTSGFGTTLFYSLGSNTASVAFAALNDLALITSAYNASGVKERSGGWYRLDCPDGMFATAGVKPRVIGDATGFHLIHEMIEVVGFDPTLAKPPVTLNASDVTGNVPTDVQTIKTQAVTCGAGVTFPSQIASPTNITAGTITTVTTVGTVTNPVTLPTTPPTGYATPTDYQQRGVAVTLPSSVPSGYGTSTLTTTDITGVFNTQGSVRREPSCYRTLRT